MAIIYWIRQLSQLSEPDKMKQIIYTLYFFLHIHCSVQAQLCLSKHAADKNKYEIIEEA